MSRAEYSHPPRRPTRKPITAGLGGLVLASSMMLGTSVSPAAAETTYEILTKACTKYVPDPRRESLTDCSGANLSGADLTGVNLYRANLTGANLPNAKLNGANLDGANLANANLTYANLTGAYLNDANLFNAHLIGADLNNTMLSRVNLNVANLTGANLTNSNLADTNLTSANLYAANLNSANLYAANLTYANLGSANLNSAELGGAKLNGAKLNGADLTATKLYAADLTGANLSSAILTDTILTYTNLTNANLTDATVADGFFYGTNMTNSILTRTSAVPADITVTTESPDGAHVTWAIPDVPDGLTFGTCNATSETLFPLGATPVTCTVTSKSVDSMGHDILTTGSGTFTVNVTRYTAAPSFVDPPAQPLPAVAGTPFTHTITVTGTPTPAITITGQPDWLTLTNGTLSGTPPTAGSYPFTVTATNGTTPNATLQVTVNVIPAPVAPSFVNPPQSPLNAVANSPFTPYTFTATGIPKPAITITEPTKLPPGMTFGNDPVTGVPTLTGTPTTAGSYTFALTASNGVGDPATLAVTVTVDPYTEAPVFIDTAPVALTGTVGTILTGTFTATGTPTPAITVVDPSKLPPGMTFANGVLSGTPTTAGSYPFTVTATNGTTPNPTLQVTVNVIPAPVVTEPPATGSLGSRGSSFFGFGS